MAGMHTPDQTNLPCHPPYLPPRRRQRTAQHVSHIRVVCKQVLGLSQVGRALQRSLAQSHCLLRPPCRQCSTALR